MILSLTLLACWPFGQLSSAVVNGQPRCSWAGPKKIPKGESFLDTAMALPRALPITPEVGGLCELGLFLSLKHRGSRGNIDTSKRKLDPFFSNPLETDHRGALHDSSPSSPFFRFPQIRLPKSWRPSSSTKRRTEGKRATEEGRKSLHMLLF